MRISVHVAVAVNVPKRNNLKRLSYLGLHLYAVRGKKAGRFHSYSDLFFLEFRSAERIDSMPAAIATDAAIIRIPHSSCSCQAAILDAPEITAKISPA
jgi:hypothetical protein